jgi:hypothetical protein
MGRGGVKLTTQLSSRDNTSVLPSVDDFTFAITNQKFRYRVYKNQKISGHIGTSCFFEIYLILHYNIGTILVRKKGIFDGGNRGFILSHGQRPSSLYCTRLIEVTGRKSYPAKGDYLLMYSSVISRN